MKTRLENEQTQDSATTRASSDNASARTIDSHNTSLPTSSPHRESLDQQRAALESALQIHILDS